MPDKTTTRTAPAFAAMTPGDVIIAITISEGTDDDDTIADKVRIATTIISKDADGKGEQEPRIVRRIADASAQAALDAQNADDPDKAITRFADGDAAALRALLVKVVKDALDEHGFVD